MSANHTTGRPVEQFLIFMVVLASMALVFTTAKGQESKRGPGSTVELVFSAERNSVSLHDDQVPDLALIRRSNRHVLQLLGPGHILSLGLREPQTIASEWDLLLSSWPEKERRSLSDSFASGEPISTRGSIPLTLGHTYVGALADTGAGRGSMRYVLAVKELSEDSLDAKIELRVIESEKPQEFPAAKSDTYLRLFSASRFRDPIRSTFCFSRSARDLPWSPLRTPLFLDLIYGAAGETLGARVNPGQRSLLLTFRGDVSEVMNPDLWRANVEPEPDTPILFRLSQGHRDELYVLSPTQIDKRAEFIDLLWRPITTMDDLAEWGFELLDERLDQSPSDAESNPGSRPCLVWWEIPFADSLGLPFSLRSAEVSASGDFQLSLPPDLAEPLTLWAWSETELWRRQKGLTDWEPVEGHSLQVKVQPGLEPTEHTLRLKGPHGFERVMSISPGESQSLRGLPAGPYEVFLTTEGFFGYEIAVLGEDPSTAEVSLQPIEAGTFFGRVVDAQSGRAVQADLSASHPDGWVMEGPAYLGWVTLAGFPLDEEEVELWVKADGYHDLRVPISIEQNGVALRLEPKH